MKSLEPQYLGQPNIFMYHSPVKIDKFENMGINLQLAGHAHDGQLFPLSYITKLIYHGYNYGLHQIGGYTLYTTAEQLPGVRLCDGQQTGSRGYYAGIGGYNSFQNPTSRDAQFGHLYGKQKCPKNSKTNTQSNHQD